MLLWIMFSAAAQLLERGELLGAGRGSLGALASLCAASWAPLAARSVVRRLALPEDARVVTVGGSTLGGSGKTPLAIACAAHLAASLAAYGERQRVAFVGHGYRASPRRPRVVRPDDPVDEVGDEALLAARALAPLGVPVVVAPRRRDAVRLAAQSARVLVIDGVAQTAPARASLALLAVDAVEPWGHARAVPPAGDLRAPRESLLAACDRVVAIGDAEDVDARVVSRGAWQDGTLRAWGSLGATRWGLLSALSRPDRVVRGLIRRGIAVGAVVRVRDHGPFDRRALLQACASARSRGRGTVDGWLVTPKCALHLPPGFPAPVAALDYSLVLSPSLRSQLDGVAPCRGTAPAP
jgi:tetraacyldisaccharide 4'-kinase